MCSREFRPLYAEDGCPTGDLKGVKESSDSMDLEVCSESRDSSESSSCLVFSGTAGGATAGTRRHIISPDANLTINNFVAPSRGYGACDVKGTSSPRNFYFLVLAAEPNNITACTRVPPAAS